MREAGIAADVSAGLSLGEYGALITSGVLDMETAFRVVRQSSDRRSDVLDAEKEAVQVDHRKRLRGGHGFKVECKKRLLPLKDRLEGQEKNWQNGEGSGKSVKQKCITVRGICDHRSEGERAEAIKKGQRSVSFSNAGSSSKDRLQNMSEEEAIKEFSIVERMIADGVDTFVEIGPGKTLTGFLRKIDCSVKGFSIEKPEDLEKVLESRGNR